MVSVRELDATPVPAIKLFRMRVGWPERTRAVDSVKRAVNTGSGKPKLEVSPNGCKLRKIPVSVVIEDRQRIDIKQSAKRSELNARRGQAFLEPTID